jgi:hypothetical protein
MDYERSIMLLNLLKDGEVHALNEALQIDPGCPLVSWRTIAIDIRNRGWIDYTRLNGCLRILQPGTEHLNNLSPGITALRIGSPDTISNRKNPDRLLRPSPWSG